MTPEMIEQWAREAANTARSSGRELLFNVDREWAQRFASLAFAAGAEAMRRDAAQACETAQYEPDTYKWPTPLGCAEVIRALPLPKE